MDNAFQYHNGENMANPYMEMEDPSPDEDYIKEHRSDEYSKLVQAARDLCDIWHAPGQEHEELLAVRHLRSLIDKPCG